MDVALIRKLLDKTPIEDLRKYLEIYNSDDEAIQRMTGAEMLRYMEPVLYCPLAMNTQRHLRFGNIT